MPRICIDKRTGKVYPDFQGNPTPGTLIGNAVRFYKKKGENVTQDDFFEKQVDEAEYKRELDTWAAPLREKKKQEEEKRQADLVSAKNKLKQILTDDEIKALFPNR